MKYMYIHNENFTFKYANLNKRIDTNIIGLI